MDQGAIALLIPVLALSIPVLAIVSGALKKHWELRIEEARIRAGSLEGGSAADLDQVRSELDDVRRELSELQERVDFSERLLAQKAITDRGPSGAEKLPP